MSEPLEHGSLPPMKHRRSGRYAERVLAVIEEAGAILHITNGPVGYLHGKGEGFGILGTEVCESVDRL